MAIGVFGCDPRVDDDRAGRLRLYDVIGGHEFGARQCSGRIAGIRNAGISMPAKSAAAIFGIKFKRIFLSIYSFERSPVFRRLAFKRK